MIELRPLSGALGAEVSGLDLASELAPATVAELRAALVEHLVLTLPDQKLDPERLLAFAAQIGEPVEYPFLAGVDGYPEVVEVVKKEDETIAFGGVWHADTTYLEEPPMGAILYAVEVPPHGGDTLFANMSLAYERLSAGMTRLLQSLRALNVAGKAATAATRAAVLGERAKAPARAPSSPEPLRPGAAGETALEAWHPVVRTHPETGRKSLFVNPAHTVRFEEMTEAESQPLLEFLWAHQVRPEHTCRLSWRSGSLALWDNRATLHLPINDYDGHRRVMHRVSLRGDRPR